METIFIHTCSHPLFHTHTYSENAENLIYKSECKKRDVK